MRIVKDYFEPCTEKISDNICKRWTPQAVECYKLKCDCTKCSIKREYYSFACQMPKVLDLIIKAHGIPEKLKKIS